MGNIKGSPWYIKGAPILMDAGRDLEGEEDYFLSLFRELGLPASDMYVNRTKKDYRTKVRLEWRYEPNLEAVARLAQEVVPLPIQVIDQGYYAKKGKYVVDVVWLEPRADFEKPGRLAGLLAQLGVDKVEDFPEFWDFFKSEGDEED